MQGSIPLLNHQVALARSQSISQLFKSQNVKPDPVHVYFTPSQLIAEIGLAIHDDTNDASAEK